jgi:toxin YoeB
LSIVFHDDAWDDYLHWQRQDRQTLKRLNKLIMECTRTPFAGTGKPEPLRGGDLSGWWSRRIDEEHRLVCRAEDGNLIIAQCRYHYRR